jgi:hypothetical protein
MPRPPSSSMRATSCLSTSSAAIAVLVVVTARYYPPRWCRETGRADVGQQVDNSPDRSRSVRSGDRSPCQTPVGNALRTAGLYQLNDVALGVEAIAVNRVSKIPLGVGGTHLTAEVADHRP